MEQKTTADIFLPLIQRVEEPYRKLLAATYVEGLSAGQIAARYLLEVEHVQEDLVRAYKAFAALPHEIMQARDADVYLSVVAYVLAEGTASTAQLQRRFKLGWFHTTRMLDQMHVDGIVGPPNGGKPRTVLIILTTQS